MTAALCCHSRRFTRSLVCFAAFHSLFSSFRLNNMAVFFVLFFFDLVHPRQGVCV